MASGSVNMSRTDSFTMIILDFDDTLIPSRLYQFFASDLSIDLFEMLAESTLTQLQNTIISSLDSIRSQYIAHDQNVQFCVVSNAKQEWLEYMLKGAKEHKISARFPILDKYFSDNQISVISACSKTYEFLQQKFGDKADGILHSTMDRSPQNDNKWMWKYTAFSSIISEHERKLNMKCHRVVSIGDGNDEQKATKHYAKTHKIESINIRFLKGPTFNQLINQWTYTKNILFSLFEHTQTGKFYNFDLRELHRFKCDNNKLFTGKTNQLVAVRKCFQIWMDELNQKKSTKEKKNALGVVCQTIHKRMYSSDPERTSTKATKIRILRGICRNEEFNDALNEYYQRIERIMLKKKRKRENL